MINKNLFYYINKHYNEAEIASKPAVSSFSNIQKTNNDFLSRKYGAMLSKIDTSNIRNFLDSIDDNKDNVFKNIINRLQNKQDAETIEDKFVDSKIEELSKDPKLKNSILNLIYFCSFLERIPKFSL